MAGPMTDTAANPVSPDGKHEISGFALTRARKDPDGLTQDAAAALKDQRGDDQPL
jgi:hypothetical protein